MKEVKDATSKILPFLKLKNLLKKKDNKVFEALGRCWYRLQNIIHTAKQRCKSENGKKAAEEMSRIMNEIMDGAINDVYSNGVYPSKDQYSAWKCVLKRLCPDVSMIDDEKSRDDKREGAGSNDEIRKDKKSKEAVSCLEILNDQTITITNSSGDKVTPFSRPIMNSEKFFRRLKENILTCEGIVKKEIKKIRYDTVGKKVRALFDAKSRRCIEDEGVLTYALALGFMSMSCPQKLYQSEARIV